MLDIQSMILSQRVIALKRFIEDYNSPWKSVLETFLGDIGGKFILRCNFDTRKLPIYLPDFYKECLDAWSDVSTTVLFLMTILLTKQYGAISSSLLRTSRVMLNIWPSTVELLK